MKPIHFLLLSLFFILPISAAAQNTGIGTNNPQQKLHVAGNIRVDALTGTNGILTYNSSGDLVPLTNSGNVNDVLLGNGGWGTVNGILPTGAVVATPNYNDLSLISKGFKLYGSLPGFTRYSSSLYNAPASSWAVTYFEGDVSKYSPPSFDSKDIMFWTDTVLYLFADNSMYVYNPVSDVWRFLLTNPTSFLASAESKSIWTGTELIVWGGHYTNSTNNGFRYNPVTNVWTAIPTSSQPEARGGFAMQLINNRIVIWGGLSSGGVLLNSGAMLNLGTNTWTTMSTTGAPSPRYNFASVANSIQNTLLVWGGQISSTLGIVTGDGARFDPLTNSWTAINTVGAPVERRFHSASWSGTEMIVFGGTNNDGTLNSGGKYNPVTNSWTSTSLTGAPIRSSTSSIWTGSKLLISGGNTGNNSVGTPFASDSYLYDPIPNNWTPAGVMGVSKGGHKSILAGNMILVFGGGTAVLNPVTGSYSFYGGYPQGSRYFLSAVSTSRTQIFNISKLYLYIKE